jgi:hypothetical protein
VWLSGIPAYSAASSRPAESARIRLAGPRTVARLSHALRRPRLRGRASCSTLLALLVGRACKVRVDERDRLVFVAGHEMPIAVECDLDRAVAEVGREGLCVDAGRDQNRCERVPAFVQADRLNLRLLPSPVGPVD